MSGEKIEPKSNTKGVGNSRFNFKQIEKLKAFTEIFFHEQNESIV